MKLHEYIALKRRTPFQWGVHDCATFAANWGQAATGKNYFAGLPAWESEAEAQAVLDSVGGIVAAVDAHLERIDPALAVDGDIALRQGGLCIFSGNHIVTTGPARLLFADRTEAECAWSLR